MKKITSLLFALLGLTAVADAQFMYDINGQPVRENTYVDVEGSPYLFDEWYKGIVKVAKTGKVYDDVKLRYDAYKDELEYEKEGQLLRLTSEILEFSIPTGDALYEFRRGFPAVGDQNENSFYRVLYDGNTKLLKRYEMRLREDRAYSSATTTKRFDLGEETYILKDGQMNKTKKNDKKGLLKLLADEKNLMNYVIKEEQLDFKTDDDTAKLLEEYDAYKAGRKGEN